MTPSHDRAIRKRADQILAWATKELKETEWEHPECMIGEPMAEYRLRAQAARDSTKYLDEYREWLYNLKHFCEQRRRHPLVRLLQRTRYMGRIEKPGHEPGWLFHWHGSTEDDANKRRTKSRSLTWGDTMALGLPDLNYTGRAWFDALDRKLNWSIEWSLGPGMYFSNTLGLSLSVDGDDRDVNLSVHIPLLGSVYLSLSHMAPKWLTFPKERRFTTYEPYIFPAGYEIQPGDRKPVHHSYMMGQDNTLIEFSLTPEHVSAALFSVGEHMQSEGRRRFYKFWPDWILGKTECSRVSVDSPVKAIACFPEGQYELTLQRELSTWKRSHWPWPYWRKSVDITATRPPEFQGKGENSYDCGPDAIYGMSSEGHSYEDAVAAYTKATLRDRAKRGHINEKHRSVFSVGSNHDE